MSRRHLGWLALALLATLGPLGGTSQGRTLAAPLLFGNDPRIDPAAFRVTVFARRLFFPMGMTSLPDGSLLVAESVPNAGDGFFDSTGELVRFVDSKGDGGADDAGTVLASDLPGTLVAVARGGSLLFVTSAEAGRESISVLRRGKTWHDPLSLVGAIDFRFDNFEHQTYGLAVRPYAAKGRRYELYFNVGASGNDTAGRTVDLSGLVTATLADAALYRVGVEDTGDAVTVSPPTTIATGLRNAAAFAFDPRTGDLLITDNGIDTPSDPQEGFSADELDRIPAAAIGRQPADFGFPDSYVAYRTGTIVGHRGSLPAIAFQPIAGSESKGAAGIAIAPPAFPNGLNAGIFVGFHGQWDAVGRANKANPVVYADLATGRTLDFIANDDPNVGHIDDLLSTQDTLFAADLCGGAGASIAGSDPCGTIYEIRAQGKAGDGTG
jgi:glucose/arabinose dehydrogenase